MADVSPLDHCYDVCVVGAGMVGSSAAKYIALKYHNEKFHKAKSVCLVGPKEPQSRLGQTVFAAHYDETRICRSTATDTLWAVLASRSIARYRQIEAESGIEFYKEVGCLNVGDPGRENFVAETLRSAEAQNINTVLLDNSALRQKFPYINLSKDHTALLETVNAGYINPRKLVQAQILLAERYGCDIVHDIIRSVSKSSDSATGVNDAGETITRLETDCGRVLFAKKVLLATNAFTEGFRDLLPPGVKLDMQPVTQGIVLSEISSSDLIQIGKTVPSMLLRSLHSNPRPEKGTDEGEETFDCYVLPPVVYPDGKVYMKLGHGKKYDSPLPSNSISDWYINPLSSEMSNILKAQFQSAFPGITPLSYRTDTCVTVDTPTERPFIDHITPDLCVAVGDCGGAAKSCDEIGRLAAHLVFYGCWSPEESLKHELFRVCLKQK